MLSPQYGCKHFSPALNYCTSWKIPSSCNSYHGLPAPPLLPNLTTVLYLIIGNLIGENPTNNFRTTDCNQRWNKVLKWGQVLQDSKQNTRDAKEWCEQLLQWRKDGDAQKYMLHLSSCLNKLLTGGTKDTTTVVLPTLKNGQYAFLGGIIPSSPFLEPPTLHSSVPTPLYSSGQDLN